MFPNYGFVEGENHTMNAVLQIWREEMQKVYMFFYFCPLAILDL